MSSRRCKQDVDSFCFICGEFIKIRSKKFSLATNLKLCKAYEAYFNLQIRNQDKKWVPQFSCINYKNTLEVQGTICVLLLYILKPIAAQHSTPPVLSSSLASTFPMRTEVDHNLLKESRRLITEKAEKFALEFLKRVSDGHVKSPNKSYMVSPFALWSLLLLLAEGAEGNTLQELLKTLNLDSDPQAIRNAYSQIAQQLTVNTPTIEVASYQAVFTDINKPVNADYENLVSRVYKSSLIPVNFGDVNNTFSQINADINKATRGLLPSIVQPQDFRDAALVMISALYFKGKWKYPFKPAYTRSVPFHDENGQVSGNVQMMTKTGPFNYINMKVLESYVLELPYGREDRLSMLIILPKRSVRLNTVIGNLRSIGINQIINELRDSAAMYQDGDLVDVVEVSLPKFQTSSHLSLRNILSDMGINDVFQPSFANLDKMAKNIYVGSIFQSTRIIVNEEGTEAAAVTTAVLVNKASPTKFTLDRPFAYIIVEKTSGLLLFAGEVRSHLMT